MLISETIQLMKKVIKYGVQFIVISKFLFLKNIEAAPNIIFSKITKGIVRKFITAMFITHSCHI